MQTPQCSFARLDQSSLQSLQKLRTALQDIPKKFLPRHEGEPDDSHLFGTISGDCNYNFTFKVEGGGFFQSGAGMLVAAAERTSGSLPVPLKCRWKRRVHDLVVDIPGVTTNMYQISADDIGTHVIVEASPADSDDGLYGSVVGEIGPFELDPMTRRNLDNALGRGLVFAVSQARPPSDVGASPPSRPDHHIHVTSECIRVAPLDERGDERSHKEVSAEYTAEYPRVIIHTLDTVRFQLSLSESRSFSMIAESRASRDLLALTIRCFHANRFVPIHTVVDALLPPHQLHPQGQSMDNRLDMCIMVERLVMELNKSVERKEVADKVLRNTKVEKKNLQEQLMESIEGCTDVIVGLQMQYGEGGASTASTPDPAELREQTREQEASNAAVRQLISQEVEKRERLRQARLAAEEAKPVLQKNLEERDSLRARLSALSMGSSAKQQDQADQSHALELKRLRQDVEALHNQKEQLRKHLQEKERERQELQDNFFYVKSQLDKWQIRVAQDADGEGACKELERQSATINGTIEERTRLAMRLESCLRDQEKDKVYHEQQVERLMQANARLHEEKDRAARDVQRLSKMYADAVAQLQSDNSALAQDLEVTELADQAAAGARASPEELDRIRRELTQVDEDTRAKESENESLRTRIRKLARE
mmetsp:Transcript_23662/g.67947  ORF Transcript_23662/g.67947 Transcript_23662/m.67947 type:complete len:654 (+) Transcript_23662:140-2101(+)